MISANEARDMMPSLRRGTIMNEVEELIIGAAKEDKKAVKLPKGFFGNNVEQDVMYNAKTPPLYAFVHDELVKNGYKLGRNVEGLFFVITWA